MINASQKEFKGIETAEEMQSFLKEKGKNHNYYYHYTAAGSLIKIIQSGYFFLTKGNYIKMNDQQECMAKGSLDVWDRTYIGCFSYGESENMAMWGLYSIPWEDAVRISIPQKEMREWICNRRTCVYAVTDDGAIVDSNIGNKHPKIELTDIVYIGRTESGNSLKLNYLKRESKLLLSWFGAFPAGGFGFVVSDPVLLPTKLPAAAGTGFVICPNATIVGTAYAAFLRKLLLDSILSLFSIL